MENAGREFLGRGAVKGGHIGLVAHDDAYIVDAVTEWACGALSAGGGAILAGTAFHLDAIRKGTRGHRVDIASAERDGRAVLIEADWLLAKFMIDGTPDGARFRALLQEIMAPLAQRVGSPKRVRAWGEMVSLLYMRGAPAAARRIEVLWEDALHEQGFSLLCTYQGPSGGNVLLEELIADVASTHASHHVQPPQEETTTI